MMTWLVDLLHSLWVLLTYVNTHRHQLRCPVRFPVRCNSISGQVWCENDGKGFLRLISQCTIAYPYLVLVSTGNNRACQSHPYRYILVITTSLVKCWQGNFRFIHLSSLSLICLTWLINALLWILLIGTKSSLWRQIIFLDAIQMNGSQIS